MAARDGFSPAEKKLMLLSHETSTGLKFTGMFAFLCYYSAVLYILCYFTLVSMQ